MVHLISQFIAKDNPNDLMEYFQENFAFWTINL